MVIEKKGTENIEIGLPKWLENILNKKWFFPLAVIVVFFIAIWANMTPAMREDATSWITGAKTATDGLSPTSPNSRIPQQGGLQNTGSPTPSPTTTGQEKISISAGGYKPKFYPDGETGEQEIALDNIPAMITLRGGIRGSKIYIKNLQKKENYLMQGYVGTKGTRYNNHQHSLSFIFLDNNGRDWVSVGRISVTEGKESELQIPMPEGAKYLKILAGG